MGRSKLDADSGALVQGALGGQAGGPPQVGAQQVQGPKVGSMAAPADRFGLLGLLGVIRMTDPDLTTLALGTDLTTLGLHLNSPENVYKTFASPWADQPLRPEPDFRVSHASTSLGKKRWPHQSS